MKFLILFIFFGLSCEALVRDQQCPVRPMGSAVDVKRFSGNWFAVKSVPNYHEHSFDCLHYNFAYVSPYETELTFCEKLHGIHHCDQFKNVHDEQNGKFIGTVLNNRKFFVKF